MFDGRVWVGRALDGEVSARCIMILELLGGRFLAAQVESRSFSERDEGRFVP